MRPGQALERPLARRLKPEIARARRHVVERRRHQDLPALRERRDARGENHRHAEEIRRFPHRLADMQADPDFDRQIGMALGIGGITDYGGSLLNHLAVPGSGGSDGREARRRQQDRQFLDKPTGALLLFSGNLAAGPARASLGARGRIHGFSRNENEAKPLKSNDPAKCPISHR